MAPATDFQSFLHNTSYADVPEPVLAFGRRCLLDLIGVGIGGSKTELSSIIRAHAEMQFGVGSHAASLMFDGRSVSPAGAALANGMTIDALDAHDGYKPVKGHVGVHVLAALLATSQAEGRFDGQDFLSNLVIGYELGSRLGAALHGTVSDYHTSGAWGAVACAALSSKVLGLDFVQTREAIGIAEYHGPRSQMMRVIDHPTMLKDGSGWGAMAGVSAAYLAQAGFTGAPAITVEGDDVAEYWLDLGERWLILEQYFKAYPVCRWAQPAVEATMSLVNQHQLETDAIDYVEIFTFHEGCRLATRRPNNTEEAQYSLPFPVAATLVRGRLGPEEVSGEALNDPAILRLCDRMKLTEVANYNAVFPEQRLAHATIHLRDGRIVTSDVCTARGDPENHLGDDEIVEKFHFIADPIVGAERALKIRQAIAKIGVGSNLDDLLPLVTMPPKSD